jgi:putative hydrolase of HD superfamily
MLIVAMISYLCSVELDACDKRLYNNFFTALFHDLPEALTRDIISPVKKSIEGLDKIIQEYEQAEFNKKILPLLPQSWQNEMRYFLTDEFKSRILNNGKKEFVSSEEINKYFNHDEYSPVDGDIIKVCDHLSAYIEAVLSIEHGIASHHLIKGKEDLYLSNKNKNIAGIHFGQIFDYFK